MATRAGRKIRHKNITRIDHPAKRTFGYFVRVQWNGERRTKFFSDGVYGDRLGALDAALEWRNATEAALGKPRTERLVIGKIRTKSGVPGVRLRKNGNTDYYEATWVTTVGKQGRTSYSVAKHGARKALQLARKARQLHEKQRLHTPPHPDE